MISRANMTRGGGLPSFVYIEIFSHKEPKKKLRLIPKLNDKNDLL